MELSNSQKSAVTAWIQEGQSLADVQALLREEFQISMTYMDVRFLVDDLDIAMVEPDEADDATDETKPAEAVDAEVVDEAAAPGVVVDVDAIMRPGSLVSGTVTFSDGKSLGWQLGATGQLGLIPDEDDAEYRPSPEDVEAFQVQLQDVLKKKGY
ncbi:MAG: hypothetical protein ACPGIC_04325 [Opitutales bacterium]